MLKDVSRIKVLATIVVAVGRRPPYPALDHGLHNGVHVARHVLCRGGVAGDEVAVEHYQIRWVGVEHVVHDGDCLFIPLVTLRSTLLCAFRQHLTQLSDR